MSKWAVLDLETTVYPGVGGDKAAWYNPQNWIVLMGWCTNDDRAAKGLRNAGHGQEQAAYDKFIELVSDPDMQFIVGHNIGFDLHYLMRDPDARAAWMRYVARGGLVWDTQIAEYIINGQDQASHMTSLNDCCLRYGLETKIDEVKILWEQGYNTDEIDPKLLMEYLIGRELVNHETGMVVGFQDGDIGLTRDVFLAQLPRIREQGQSRLLRVEMGARCAGIEMEFNGMHVDRELGEYIASELRVELDESTAELNKYLPENLPFVFNWTNRYHLSPLLFGGKVKYQRRQYDLKDGTTTFVPPAAGDAGSIYAYAQKDEPHYVMDDGKVVSIEQFDAWFFSATGDTSVSPWGPRAQYKSGKNAGEYKTKRVKVDDHDKPKSRMVDDYWEFPGFTKPLEEWASSTEGLYSCSAEVLDALSEYKGVEFLEVFGRVRAITKDLTTYFINEDGTKGMLTQVGEDGLVHHRLLQTSTVTGRLSCIKPNLQNLSNVSKSRARELFTSRFKNGVVVGSDFTSLEVYVQGMLTHCSQLLLDLESKIDMHCMRLAYQEGMDYEEVKRLAKGYTDENGVKHEPVEEWVEKRRLAKVFTFQRQYGAGVQTLMKQTGLSKEVIEKLIAADEDRYPEVSQWFAKFVEDIYANAVPTSNFFMHPCNPAIKVQQLTSQVKLPDGKLYTFKSEATNSLGLKRGKTTEFSSTQPLNFPVQGTGGQIAKMAMWVAVREFYRMENFGGRALLVNMVHDAQYCDADPSVKYQAAALLTACMTVASDAYGKAVGWELPVRVPTDTQMGPNLAEEHGIDDAVYHESVVTFTEELTARYL